MKLTPNLVGPAWIMAVGIVALWLPAPGVMTGLLLFTVSVVVVPILLIVFLAKRSD